MTTIKDYLNDMAHDIIDISCGDVEAMTESDIKTVVDDYAEKINDLLIKAIGHD